uniref:Uncharacterized protein n=1 Tax=Anguilla anguilla TaxID=7936 RepID=A0A0E9V8H5_ANGAN
MKKCQGFFHFHLVLRIKP